MNEPAPDLALAASLFRTLHDDSADGDGVTRDAYGAGEQRAHDRIAAAGRTFGLEQHVDYAGNLALTLPGRDRSASRLMIGSHLDSVVQGGDYDGPVGVLAGLACLAGMRHANWTPARDITLLVTRAEEAGAWFPVSFPGSRAALGMLPPEALSLPRRDTGRTLEEHLRSCGFDPSRIRAGEAWLGPQNVAAFLEVHIEQGPVLDSEGLAAGIVTGIPGSRRHRAGRITGETNHSGATPRAHRRDAAIAVAELAYRLDRFWQRLEAEGHELVCTFCVLGTGPDAGFTRIAGSACFELDMRSRKRASLDLLHDELERLASEIAGARNVDIALGPETGSEPCELDPGLQQALLQTAAALSIPVRSLPSGGGHDAVAFAQAGIPSALLFVRNQTAATPHANRCGWKTSPPPRISPCAGLSILAAVTRVGSPATMTDRRPKRRLSDAERSDRFAELVGLIGRSASPFDRFSGREDQPLRADLRDGGHKILERHLPHVIGRGVPRRKAGP